MPDSRIPRKLAALALVAGIVALPWPTRPGMADGRMTDDRSSGLEKSPIGHPPIIHSPIGHPPIVHPAISHSAIVHPAIGHPGDDDLEERRAMARRSFVENCLMCHGEDMTTRQRLTTKQWTTEVEKMVGWGAPLPPPEKQPLVDYLAETYPSGQPAPPIERLTADEVAALGRQGPPSPLPSSDPARGEALYATHCATCHGATGSGGELGTNLRGIPILLRDEEFRAVVRGGRRRMPGFAAVLDEAREADLLAWLRRAR